MDRKKISIIIPVYKTEQYLRECIDSVLKQTYGNIEVILVDDGSPDRAPEIIDGYAMADSRIKAIHQENRGLSDARNTGLAAATGDYIGFLDSDDYMEPFAIEHMAAVLEETDSDMVVCDYRRVDGDGKILKEHYLNIRETVCVDEAGFWKMYEHAIPVFNVVWSKLYKRHVAENVMFPLGKAGEDLMVLPEYVAKCRRIAVSPCVTVNYRKVASSISSTQLKSQMVTNGNIDETEGCLKLCRYLGSKGYRNSYVFEFGMGSRLLINAYRKRKSAPKEVRDRIKYVYGEYCDTAREISKDSGLPLKMRLWLFRHNFGLYSLLQQIHSKE